LNKPYKLLDHTADIGIETTGDTFMSALSNVIFAMYDLMIDMKNVEIIIERRFSLKRRTDEDTVVDVLENVLFYFETEHFIGKKIEIINNGSSIDIVMKGEKFDPLKHKTKFEIKAITYHKLVVKRRKGKWIMRVIFDV